MQTHGNYSNARRTQTNPQQAMASMNPFAPREINIEIPKSKWDNIKTLAKTGKPVIVARMQSKSSLKMYNTILKILLSNSRNQ